MKKEQTYTSEEVEKKRKLSLVLYAFSLIGAIVLLIILFTQDIEIFYVGPVMAVLVVAFIAATEIKTRIQPALAEAIMREIHSPGLEITYSQKAGIPEKYFRHADFIKHYDVYKSFDFILGKLEDRDFILSGAVIKNRSKTAPEEEPKVIYEGIFGITDFKNEDNIEMIIAPDIQNKFLNGIFEDMKKALGGDKKVVRLENPEFERFFEVYSNDQVASRKIITLVFMEKMVEFRRQVKKNVTLIYKNNKAYFFIENRYVVDTNKLYFKGINQETISEATEFIRLLGEIVTNVATPVSEMKTNH